MNLNFIILLAALFSVGAQPVATTSIPDPTLSQLARDLHTKAEVARHITNNPNTPPEMKAYYQGRVDALIEAADLAMSASVQPTIERSASGGAAKKSLPVSESSRRDLLP